MADGGHASAVGADLRRSNAPARLLAAVEPHLGPIDVLVAAAGSGRQQTLEEVSIEDFDEMIAVNLRAPFFLVQSALPALKASPAAVVVNVSSAAAGMYRPRQTVYGLTKAGIEHEYMLFPDEGHGFAKPANRITFYTAAERFLARYLGGRFEE